MDFPQVPRAVGSTSRRPSYIRPALAYEAAPFALCCGLSFDPEALDGRFWQAPLTG